VVVEQGFPLANGGAITRRQLPILNSNFGGFAEIVMGLAKITVWTAWRTTDDRQTGAFRLSGQRLADRWIALMSGEVLMTGR
jgi:hypothetical protein